MSDELPRKFGKYLLERRLGVGGMAETFVARREGQAGIVQHVCIKRVLPAFHKDPEFIRQFQREARLAAKLRHQNIVQVLDFGYVGETLYMALELVRGLDLRDFLSIQEGKKLGIEYVGLIAHDLIYALDYAHKPHDGVDGIVHRDLTPSNVLISRNGHAKLADFGVAKAIGTSTVATATGVMKGKMPYMPSEQMKGGAVDGRTDLWSLGVVLFEALAGRRPFVGAHDVEVMTKIIANQRPKLIDLCPELPQELCDVVEKLLSPEPDDRYPNADAVLDAIAPFVPTPKWRRQLAAEIREAYGDTERGPDERDTKMAEVAELPANVPGARQVAVAAEARVDAEGPTDPASGDGPTVVGASERPPPGRLGTLAGVGPDSQPPPAADGDKPTHLDLEAQARAAAAAVAAMAAEGGGEEPDTDEMGAPPVAGEAFPGGASVPEHESSGGLPKAAVLGGVLLFVAAAVVGVMVAMNEPAEPEPELVAGAGPETGMATDPAGSESGPETADRDPDAENGAPNAEDGDPAVSAESDLPRGVDPPETEAAAMAESAMTPTTTESAMTPTMTESAMAAAPVQVNVACIPWGEVWVGQRYMGRAPVQLRLEPGTHTIRAGAGSPQFTKRVRVRPGRRRMNVTFDLDALMRERAAMR